MQASAHAIMTGPRSQMMIKYPNVKSTHRGFDLRAGGDEKQLINLA
jgi:hypothetical protein